MGEVWAKLWAINVKTRSVLIAEKDSAEAHYSLEGLPNKILAAKYQTVLPNEQLLAELEKKRDELEAQHLDLNSERERELGMQFLAKVLSNFWGAAQEVASEKSSGLSFVSIIPNRSVDG